MPAHLSHLRADAQANRERILRAARDAFETRGLDVPMAAIARRAGVGMATLYRRFPTRESLVTEVFTDQLAECAAAVDEAVADPDAWRAFRTVVEKVCAMQAADRGFTTAFLTAFPEAVDYEDLRTHAERGLAEIVRRAKEAGHLHPGFEPADLVLLLKANDGATADAGEAAPAASRRLVAYFLRAFRADPRADPEVGTAPLPPAPPFCLEHLYGRPAPAPAAPSGR
ncbi:TetR family transcriptional regulator [Nonomuraea phyllanthi]|uniref:TetR family transcriptional regulator n=1 Tax=Nonomuraea phyllanthi TaxID=2219224 RepID=A0A5C4WJP8_9ACTN|nr:TetR/AcrR family transcriptional regulator [Nonomuraea phyllanthi]KAB8194693.1 TetR family transcriptional regulator [Nonomuraea phyllanthi]